MCDDYPIIIENKGGAVVLRAKKIWITSNLHPKDWFPELDEETLSALLRRLHVVHFTERYEPRPELTEDHSDSEHSFVSIQHRRIDRERERE